LEWRSEVWKKHSWRCSISSPGTGYIADLTYRNYDGPLEPPIYRWWAIARTSIKQSLKKKGFWVWAAFSGWWYLILSIYFYVGDSIAAGTPVGENGFFKQITWKDQFLDAFGHSQLFLLILALLIGVGSIANDNHANALLVYLSKPCSKADYLIGKWFGIFIPILCVTLIPSVCFYGYCFMSYRSYGFISQDPWLLLKLIGLAPVTAAFHASVALGISSLFNQGRLAGAVYAGFYFITSFFTILIAGIRAGQQMMNHEPPAILNTLFYFSVDGVQLAIAKNILGTAGSRSILAGNGRRGGGHITLPPIPSPVLFFGIFFVICVLALYVAWTRIRAVEVVGR
jgi:ABC-2 type transport system permease protein